MAISTRAVGTWATGLANSTSLTVTIPTSPGTPATGDLMICVASVKPYTATPTIDQSWSTLYAGTGGSTANGNGAGSQDHAVFYKVHTGTESDPTVSWGVQSSPGSAVIVVLQKGSGEQWTIQQLTNIVEQASGSDISIALTSSVGINSGDWIFALATAGDDSAAFTRATTAISGGPTYSGNYVEWPATHLDTTTGNDMAADLGYRIASSTVASGQTITVTGTLSNSERSQASAFSVRVTTATSASAGVATATSSANADTAKVSAAGTGAGAATGAALAATGRPGEYATATLAEATTAALDATVTADEGEITFDADCATATAAAVIAHMNLSASAGYARARTA